MAPLVSPLTGTLKSIKKQFIAKEKLVKSSLITQKKRADNNRKNSERERSIDYERLLERKLGFLGKPVRSVGRKLGFIESLKKFIVNVLLGFITVRLLKYLPQLTNVVSAILNVGNFIIDMSGKLLNGLITFVDKGYQAADHARILIRNVGGEDALKSFDKLSDQSNSLLNSIMIAGMMFTDFGGVGRASVSSGKAIDTGIDVIKDTLVKEAGNQAAKQAARTAVGPLGAAGIVLGTGLLASAVGEGAFQIKKLGKGLQGWLGGKVTEASQDKNPVTRFLKKGFFGWMQATLGPAIWLLNGTGVLFDIVGAPFRYGIELIRAAYMKLNDDRKGLEQQNKNLGKFDARIRDGIREHFSILSPLFNFVGMKGVSSKLQTPGSFGSLYGEKAARDMGYYKGGMVVKKFAGGGYTGEENEKKITVPRTLKEEPGAIKPGSAVGGYQSLAKVFPNTDETGRMNQYEYMTNSYDSISNIVSFGSLMSLTTKSLLGDKVTSKDYKNASDSLTSFLMSGIYEQNPLAYQKLNSVIDTDTLKSVIEGEVSNSLKDKMSEILNLLRTQVQLTPMIGVSVGKIQTKPGDEITGGGDATDAVGGARLFMAEGFPMLAAAILAGNVQAESAWKGQRTPWILNDGAGVNKGLISWNRIRITRAEKFLGKPLETASNAEQVKWIKEELKQYGLLDEFMDPSRTEDQLKSDSYKYIRWGVEGDRWKQSARILAALQRGEQGTFTKVEPVSLPLTQNKSRYKPSSPGLFNAIEYITGDQNHPNFELKGHGLPKNYHDHIAFSTIENKEKAKKALQSSGIIIGSEFRPGDRGYHGSNLAIDIPGIQWGGSGAIGQREFSGSAKVRSVLGLGGGIQPGRISGGPTLRGGVRLLHKGEYVIDKDSVELFGGQKFFSLINQVENDNQRTEAASQLINHLSQYTGRKLDQRPEVVIDNSGDTFVMSPPIVMSLPISSGGSSGGEVNWEQDMCYARG